MYDNALGRFHNIDKMTDIMPSLSPYRFAFNNPVLLGDPTVLLEEDGGGKKKDKTPTIQGREEFIIGKAKNKQPASFNYSLVSLSDWRSPNRPTLEQYNQHHGTNYQSVDDWYYHEKHIPAQKKMTTERNQAGRTVIDTLTVLATAGVGTAYVLPVAAECSPAIQSIVAALATNPTVVSIQSFMYGGVSEYAGANMFANTIGQTVANGGDLLKVNPVSVVASGYNGLAPILAGSAIDFSPYKIAKDEMVNDLNTTYNNVMLNYLGNGAKCSFRMSDKMVPNASFSTIYHGMLYTSVEAVGSSASNAINK